MRRLRPGHANALTLGTKSLPVKLRSSSPFWPVRDGLPAVYPPLEKDTATDVAVVGGGITGALLAHTFAQDGHRVLLLDRRDVASGSTSASTALLTWEIDVPIAGLARLAGRRDAERVYRLCAQGVDDLEQLARASGERTFKRAESLYLASRREHVAALRREGRDRRRIGLAARDLTRSQLRRDYGVDRRWALLSGGCARVDPYAFAHRLLKAARRRGLRVHDRTEVTSIRRERGRWTLSTRRRSRIRAKHVVIATGFEANRFLRRPRLLHLHSTYAMATEPQDDPTWARGLPLIWETARPYLYVRPVSDGRLLIGGADERFTDAARRDRLIPRKGALLRRRFHRLFPGRRTEVAFAWAGTFGDTTDGLAYVGAPGRREGPLYALGYGANGIVFSAVAARLLAARIRGQPLQDERLFAFERKRVTGDRCPSCAPWAGYANPAD